MASAKKKKLEILLFYVVLNRKAIAIDSIVTLDKIKEDKSLSIN
jgi:hypothetical protein